MEREEALLLRAIHNKLGELEHKVLTNRHDMVVEFKRYYHDILRGADAGPATVNNIEQSLAERLSDYPALNIQVSCLHEKGRHQSKKTGSTKVVQINSSQSESQTQAGSPCAPPVRSSDLESSEPNNHYTKGLNNIDSTRITPNSTSTDTGTNSIGGTAIAATGSHYSGATSEYRTADEARRAVLPEDLERKQTLPSPAVFGAAATPDKPREHEREREFQGLFTPFFLPLLDSSPNSPLTSPPLTATSTSPLAEPIFAGDGVEREKGKGKVTDSGVNVSSSADHLQGSSQKLQARDMEGSSETRARQGSSSEQKEEPQQQAASPPPSRPPHHRSSTDDTSSSTLSERSDTKVRRSALRRSSSTSKPSQQSPRRVRFEFRGTEVLPTASPQPSDFPTPRPSSPVPADQPRTFDEIVGHIDAGEEDTFDRDPPPRKISSSEALRALSRAPLEDDTIWTVVNSGPNDSGEIVHQSPVSKNMSTAKGVTKPTPVGAPTEASRVEKLTGAERIIQRPEPAEQSDDSSDEDFLSIAKPKSFQKKSPSPLKETTNARSQVVKSAAKKGSAAEAVPQQTASGKDHESSEDSDEEDDMFHFETSRSGIPSRPKQKPQHMKKANKSELSNALSADADSEDDVEDLGATTVPYGTSPAVPIARNSPPGESSTPSAAKFQVGSIGSYKGRPVMMPVVKNPEVHAEAASLGDFNTFVGGLDGRSGVDEGDLSSFRASLANVNSGVFSGTPRSLTERMLMEDAQAQRGSGD